MPLTRVLGQPFSALASRLDRRGRMCVRGPPPTPGRLLCRNPGHFPRMRSTGGSPWKAQKRKPMKRWVLLVVTGFAFVWATPSHAEEVTLTGRWEGTWDLGPVIVNLKQDGTKVTGTVDLRGASGRADLTTYNISRPIQNGKVSGAVFTFETARELGTGAALHGANLRVSGDKMTGTFYHTVSGHSHKLSLERR